MTTTTTTIQTAEQALAAIQAGISGREAELYPDGGFPRGYDNRIIFGGFAAAVAELAEYGEVGGRGVGYDPADEDAAGPADHLVEYYGGTVLGDGEPLAYVGVDGFYTLVRAGAAVGAVEDAARDCLAADEG